MIGFMTGKTEVMSRDDYPRTVADLMIQCSESTDVCGTG